MRAILVSVDYDDLLAVTLPYNRHHFEEVAIVTTPWDEATIRIAKRNDARVFTTERFYSQGAYFNKWLALEEALDVFGRHGWMCLMDSDILWPTSISQEYFVRGYLYTPRRRLIANPKLPLPAENTWHTLPMFQEWEWAGYSQIFHAEDEHLPPAPWHQTDWIHAGGADSFFQDLWPRECKLRPNWQVLHLGIPGRNWCGRVAPRIDGTSVPQAQDRMDRMQTLLLQRCHSNPYPYQAERLGGS